MKKKYAKRLLEVLNVAAVIATLSVCYWPLGVIAVPLAIVCLYIQFQGEDSEHSQIEC